MVNYANGKIYKICSINDEYECYIGSTTLRLSVRMAKHRHEFINKSNGPNSKILFDKYGIENCKIVLITKFPCTCKEELHAEEAKHIKNNNCVNKCIPGRTKEEYYQDNKEQILEHGKQYYENNKEYIAERSKKYYENNKDKVKKYQEVNKEIICEKKKQHYNNNKEYYAKKNKQYCKDNKKAIAERKKSKYYCICGSILTINSKASHEKTATHIKGEQEFYDGCEQALLELNNK